MKAWSFIHSWTSLVCTAFLLVLCVTGLPLIFRDEIRSMSASDVQAPVLAASVATLALDDLVAGARKRYPGEFVLFAFWPKESGQIVGLGMGPAQDSGLAQIRRRLFDARTGEPLGEREKEPAAMQTLLNLHRELLAGPWGTWTLSAAALLFVASLVSGAVIYGPFMRKQPFGTIRRDRTARIRSLDLHNLLGIATVVWALVVAVTGFVNTLEKSFFRNWSAETMPKLLAPYKGKPAPAVFGSPQAAAATARAALPEMVATSIGFPNTKFASPRHYMVWLRGDTPLTARLFDTVLVDAETGELSAVRGLPWYLRMLEISRPLHFGDYGGLPLKILWGLLDIVAIIVLLSGLHLWIKRHKAPAKAT